MDATSLEQVKRTVTEDPSTPLLARALGLTTEVYAALVLAYVTSEPRPDPGPVVIIPQHALAAAGEICLTEEGATIYFAEREVIAEARGVTRFETGGRRR